MKLTQIRDENHLRELLDRKYAFVALNSFQPAIKMKVGREHSSILNAVKNIYNKYGVYVETDEAQKHIVCVYVGFCN